MTWENPEFDGSMAVANYVIRVLKDDGTLQHQETVIGTSRELKINHLGFETDTTYKVHLMARNETGDGKAELEAVITILKVYLGLRSGIIY